MPACQRCWSSCRASKTSRRRKPSWRRCGRKRWHATPSWRPGWPAPRRSWASNTAGPRTRAEPPRPARNWRRRCAPRSWASKRRPRGWKGELAAARDAADTAAAQAAERQTRLDGLTNALAEEKHRREQLDGQATELHQERDELAAGLETAGERAAAAEVRADGLNQKLVEALAAARTAEAAGERAERLAQAREQQAAQAATAQRGAERRVEAAERTAERAEARADAAERRASDARAETETVREHAERAGQDLAAARAIVDELRRRATAEDDRARTRQATGGPTEAPDSAPPRPRSRRTGPPQSSTSGRTQASVRQWADIPEARIGRYTLRPGFPVRVEGLRGVHRVVRIEEHRGDGRVNVEVNQPGGRPNRTVSADAVHYVRPGSKAALAAGIEPDPGSPGSGEG
jgi:hypothetical protein